MSGEVVCAAPLPEPLLDRIRAVLRQARTIGLLGPGDVELHLRHAVEFADAAARAAHDGGVVPDAVVDLGSGAGVPGLIIAVAWHDAHVLLVEAAGRRASFLEQAIGALDLSQRVAVVARRAEDVGRDPVHRGRYPVVVARGFGRPAVTAECAAPLLRPGGILVVSAPPPGGGQPRWATEGLALLGMEVAGAVRDRFGFEVVRQVSPCPERFPRRVGVPAKRPLF